MEFYLRNFGSSLIKLFLNMISEFSFTLKIVFISFLLSSFQLHSQVKFEFGNLSDDGVKLLYQKFDAENISEGSSGSDVVWDFSHIQKTETIEKKILPADSLAKANFPDAEFMEIIGDSIFTALKEEYGRTYSLGYFDKSSQLKIAYPKSLLLSRFPVSYQDVVSRDYSSVFEWKDKKLTGEGQVKIEADAYGNLRLPDTVYNRVMRIKIHQKQTYQVEKYDLSKKAVWVTYIWLEEKERNPLLILRKNISNGKVFKEGMYLIKSEGLGLRRFNQRVLN